MPRICGRTERPDFANPSRSPHRKSFILPNKKSDRPRIFFALLATYLIWGSTYFAIAVAIETIPPFLMAGLRFTIAGSAMYAFARMRGSAHPTKAQWKSAAIVGGLLLCIGNGGVSFAEQYIASSTVALTIACTPLWSAMFAGLIGVKPRAVEWLGIALGIFGVFLLNYQSDVAFNLLGMTTLMIASLSWAGGSIWSKQLDLPNGFMSSAAQMLMGGAMLLTFSVLTGERLHAMPSMRSLSALAILTVFGSMVAYSAYGYLLEKVRPALATSNAYANPLVAVALGVGLGGEPFNGYTLVAMVIILLAVMLLALPKSAS